MTLAVANAIIERMGGREFCNLIGTSTFTCTESWVQFRITPVCLNDITWVKITKVDETYRIEGGKTVCLRPEVVTVKDQLHIRQLPAAFKSITGLDYQL